MTDDGIVKLHPPVERAVTEAAALLRNARHEAVMWDTSEHMSFIEIQASLGPMPCPECCNTRDSVLIDLVSKDQFYRADGGEDIRPEISTADDPMIPHVEALVAKSKPISVCEYWQLNKAKMQAQQAYWEKWNSPGVDILLSHVAGHTALPPGCFR